jgi:hypothetical protein
LLDSGGDPQPSSSAIAPAASDAVDAADARLCR